MMAKGMGVMAKGQRTDSDIVREVHQLAPLYRPAEIHRRLEADARFERAAVPTLRTIENIAREVTPRDASGTWTVDASTDPAEIAAVLPVLAGIIQWSEGRVARVTNREADWIHRLRSGVPDLPAPEAYRLAREYLRKTESAESTAVLDTWLAFAPWRDQGATYFEAFERGWIDSVRWSGYMPDDAGERMTRAAASRRKEGKS